MRIDLANGQFIEFDKNGSTSNLKMVMDDDGNEVYEREDDNETDIAFNSAVDGLESLLINLAEYEVITEANLYQVARAVESTLEAIANNT